MSLIIYFFSKHNLISDYTAKIFISNFSKKNLVIKKEIAEERRVVYQNIAKNKNKHFNYLIIGSSRVMQFGKLTGFQNSLNLGVSGAGLNDIKYIYKLAKENKLTYDTIIFDFNPWLSIEGTDDRFNQFFSQYRTKNAIKDIFKLDYNLEDIITTLEALNNYLCPFHPADTFEIESHSHFIKFTDGSIQQKHLSDDKRTSQIRSFGKGLYQMRSFYSINYSLLNETVNLFNEASNFSTCFVTMTPFHPELFNKNTNDIRIFNINRIETDFISSKHKFKIFGSFNPNKLNLRERDFLDGYHLKEDAIHMIFDIPR
jgi:hypothetical protein